jgi:hypothetical protein
MRRVDTAVVWPSPVPGAIRTPSLENYADRVTLVSVEPGAAWLTAWQSRPSGVVCLGLAIRATCVPHVVTEADEGIVVIAEGAAPPIALLQAPLGTRLLRGTNSTGTINVAFADFGTSAYGTVLLKSVSDPIVFTLPNGARVSLQIDPKASAATDHAATDPQPWAPKA